MILDLKGLTAFGDEHKELLRTLAKENQILLDFQLNLKLDDEYKFRDELEEILNSHRNDVMSSIPANE